MTKKNKPNLAEAVAKVQADSFTLLNNQPPQKKTSGRPSIKQILIRVPLEVHKQLKFMSVEEEREIQSLMVEALNDLFVKRNKPPIA